MRKISLFVLLFTLLFACALAEGGTYETQIIFADDDPFQAVANVNGTLYAVQYSGIYAFRPDGTKTLIASPYASDPSIELYPSDGKALYGLNVYEPLKVYKLLDENGMFVNELVYETDDLELPYTNTVIQDGKLHFLSEDGAATPIISIDFATGKIIKTPLQNVRNFTVAEDGRFICMMTTGNGLDMTVTLNAVTPETAQSTLFAQMDNIGSWGTMRYGDESQTVYYVVGSQILAAKEGGKLTRVDSCIGGDTGSVALLPGGVALTVDNALVIRQFSGQARAPLTIAEQYGRGHFYKAFIKNNPQIDLQFAPLNDQTPEEKFVQDMSMKNSDVDVYLLSDTNLLSSIKKKGYHVDMAQNAAIGARVNEMYTPFKSAMMNGDEVAAFPKECFLNMLCYNKAAFEQMGIAPPQTFEAYFDFCLKWYDEYMDAYPDYFLYPISFTTEFEFLLKHYADECARNGLPLEYNTTGMSRLMTKYQAVQKAAATHENRWEGESLFYDYYLLSMDETGAFMYMPLVFTEGAISVIPITQDNFNYFVLNPYGKNQQAALDFIASYDNDRYEGVAAVLYTTVTEPMESKEYMAELAIMQKQLETMEKQLAVADADMVNELKGQIAGQKENIESYLSYDRWAYSAGALALYKTYADFVCISDYNLMAALIAGEPNLFSDTENFDVNAFLSAVDEKITIIALEEGV